MSHPLSLEQRQKNDQYITTIARIWDVPETLPTEWIFQNDVPPQRPSGGLVTHIVKPKEQTGHALKLFRSEIQGFFAEFHEKLHDAETHAPLGLDKEAFAVVLAAVKPDGVMKYPQEAGIIYRWFRPREQQTMTEEDFRWVERQVKVIHHLGFVHLDINPRNIILLATPHKNCTAVLIDYDCVTLQNRVPVCPLPQEHPRNVHHNREAATVSDDIRMLQKLRPNAAVAPEEEQKVPAAPVSPPAPQAIPVPDPPPQAHLYPQLAPSQHSPRVVQPQPPLPNHPNHLNNLPEQADPHPRRPFPAAWPAFTVLCVAILIALLCGRDFSQPGSDAPPGADTSSQPGSDAPPTVPAPRFYSDMTPFVNIGFVYSDSAVIERLFASTSIFALTAAVPGLYPRLPVWDPDDYAPAGPILPHRTEFTWEGNSTQSTVLAYPQGTACHAISSAVETTSKKCHKDNCTLLLLPVEISATPTSTVCGDNFNYKNLRVERLPSLIYETHNLPGPTAQSISEAVAALVEAIKPPHVISAWQSYRESTTATLSCCCKDSLIPFANKFIKDYPYGGLRLGTQFTANADRSEHSVRVILALRAFFESIKTAAEAAPKKEDSGLLSLSRMSVSSSSEGSASSVNPGWASVLGAASAASIKSVSVILSHLSEAQRPHIKEKCHNLGSNDCAMLLQVLDRGRSAVKHPKLANHTTKLETCGCAVLH